MINMKEFQDFSQAFFEETGLSLISKVPLAEYSSFRIGGPADYFLEVYRLSDLATAVKAARKFGFPFT